jgi:hypothetical protein
VPADQRPDGNTVVRGQRGIGSALMASPPRWHDKMAAQLRAKGVKRVVVYNHPGDKGKLEADAAMLKNAARVVIWSSALGVRALVEGIPVQHHAPRWICAGWEVNREFVLQDMAWGQWHHEEIAKGEPFALMREQDYGRDGAGKVKAPTQ